MTDEEYEKALQEREEALINEEFKTRDLTPEEIEKIRKLGII